MDKLILFLSKRALKHVNLGCVQTRSQASLLELHFFRKTRSFEAHQALLEYLVRVSPIWSVLIAPDERDESQLVLNYLVLQLVEEQLQICKRLQEMRVIAHQYFISLSLRSGLPACCSRSAFLRLQNLLWSFEVVSALK